MPQPLIKAGRISNLTDARFFAAYMTDYISFDLRRGKVDGGLNLAEAKAIKEWLEGPKVGIELSQNQLDEADALAEAFRADFIELAFTGGFLRPLFDLQLFVRIDSGHISEIPKIESLLSENDELILDLTNLTEDEALATFASIDYLQLNHIFLALPPMETEKFKLILEDFSPKGIQLDGSQEERVGVKSFDAFCDMLDCLGS